MRWRAGFAFAALAVFLSMTSAKAEEPELRIYNWADYIGNDAIAGFEKETGIKVTLDTFDSYETLDSKILTGSSGYDIVFPDSTLAYHHIKAGLYLPLDKTRLTNYGNLDPTLLKVYQSVDPGNTFVMPYMWWTNGISYDSNKVHELMLDAPVDSLDLIFKPEVVSKFADCGVMMLDSPADVMGLALRYLRKDPNSNDPADLAAAADMLLKIRPYVRRFENSGLVNVQAAGDACLMINYSGSTVQAKALAAEAGSPVDITYVVPKEGSNIGFDGMAIPKDAPHPKNAMKFMNYMQRPDVMAATTNQIGYASVNRASWDLVDPALRSSPVLFPSDEATAKLYSSIPRTPEGLRALTREWTRVKTGQ